MKKSKKDFLVAVIVGFYTAILLLPTFKNIDVGVDYLYIALLVVLPILWVFGLAMARFLSKWAAVLYQFGKFVVIGFANSAIDFGVLNLLSIVTQRTSGFLIGGVNLPGFVIAAVHSYFWNKFWVFKKPEDAGKKPDYSDFLGFLTIVVIGIFINSGIVILVSTYINPLWGLSPERWLNIAKVVATAISLFWNFMGLKFFVFKARPKPQEDL